jgi:hypothetical protein
MKKSLLLALLLSSVVATVAWAAPAPTESAFLQSLAAPAECATNLTLATVTGQPAPEAKVNTHGCLGGFCRTSADCPCSTGAGSCIGGTCHYSTSSGGGGGGGVPGCPAAFCTTDAQCLANCSAGPNSFCGTSGTCVYVP